MAKEEKVEKVDPRRVAWEEWLDKARAQRPDPTIFDEQRKRGEFDQIPDWIK